MSVPSGFSEWRRFNGYSEAPWEWDDVALAEYRDWKLARFRAHVRHYRDCGQWDLIRAQSGREALIRLVREELDDALAPPPTQVYGRSDGRLPMRKDVGGKYPTLGPVMLGVYARLGG